LSFVSAPRSSSGSFSETSILGRPRSIWCFMATAYPTITKSMGVCFRPNRAPATILNIQTYQYLIPRIRSVQRSLESHPGSLLGPV
jgi:hypothetical protein